MALQVNEILVKHGLNACVIAYVKNKGDNISTMTQALTSIVSCEKLVLAHPFVGSCCGHAMFKCCQYATNDSKVYVGLITISIRVTSILQKNITWIKKSGKGRQEWHKTCLHRGVPSRKLKTPIKIKFASTIVLFQKTLEYKHIIALCYGQQQSLAL
jgi:hypothetical protein